MAEVLITLVVIGVVAALTVPVLNNKYQDHALKSAVKKNVSAINQAFEMYYVDNGVYFGRLDGEKRAASFDSFVTTCLKAENLGASAGLRTALNPGANKYKNKSGSSIMFLDLNFIPQTSSYRLPDGTEFYAELTVFGFVIDVNGSDRGPNVLGKDLFQIYVDESNNKLRINKNNSNDSDLYSMMYE